MTTHVCMLLLEGRNEATEAALKLTKPTETATSSVRAATKLKGRNEAVSTGQTFPIPSRRPELHSLVASLRLRCVISKSTQRSSNAARRS